MQPPSSPVQSGQLQIPTSAPNPSLPAHKRTSDNTIIKHESLQQYLNFGKQADNGCKWRKYGQKEVLGIPRMYYRCTNTGCDGKKTVEISLEGQVQVIFSGRYNQKCPRKREKRDSSKKPSDCSIHNIDSGGTGVKEKDEDEPDPKRRLIQVEGLDMAATASSYKDTTYTFGDIDGLGSYGNITTHTGDCVPTHPYDNDVSHILIPENMQIQFNSFFNDISYYSDQFNPRTSMKPSFLKLRFINSPPPMISCFQRIKAEGGFPLTIELVEPNTNTRVTSDSLSFSKIHIVPLNADISEERWTTEEFNQNILRPREGKRPLLTGDLTVTLKDGVGVIDDNLAFTDNSSWVRSGKFRLGAKATEGGAVEGITKAFKCKDKRGECFGKLHFPDINSKVWTLHSIAKKGLIDLCLSQAGIHTIKDLRRHLSMSQNAIPGELKGRIAENRWNRIVLHSMKCVLDESECYVYNSSEAHGASLLFNSVYEVMKVSFDGITELNITDLTSTQQVLLDNLKREAYQNISNFVKVKSADFLSFLSRSSKNLKDTELGTGFPKLQSIFVDETSSDISDGFEPLIGTSVTVSSSKYHDVVIRYGRGDISNDDFISHLCAALYRRGFSVYEEFDEVDRVPKCKVLIILLTSTYVPSNILNILAHQKTENLVVHPIFYGLSPHDVISNIKNYERFFLQEKPKIWQAALEELTQMPGYTLTDKSESELIDEIVRDTSKVLYSCDKVNMIGMDVQVEEILSLLRIESSDVRSIGLWGEVSVGKTTIAEEIFRRISVQYETCVFLKDLHKEFEEKGHDAVREEFLSKVLDVEPHIIRISDMKTSFLRSRLQHKRVLVILDSVSDYKDVETILGKINYFGPGSRIIMTSRNRRVFELCKTDHVYEVKPLDTPNSLLLLDRGMLQFGLSPEVYRALSLELVKFSNGNPQVLQFLSRSYKEGNSLLEEIQKTSPMYIPDIFERSCCGLDDNGRSIFLDIACFFRRMDKDNVAMLLDGCGFSAYVGFKSLVEKSLLTISHNIVDMPSFIQATGREMVHQESPDRPGHRSRLWNTEDISDVFINDSGTSAIEGIFLDISKLKFDANPNIFEKMFNLRLLKIYCSKVMGNHSLSLPQGLQYLPSKLRLLHWEYYPLKSLPQNFDPRNLVELNLPSGSAEKLWKGKKSLEKLKKMILSYSFQLKKIPRLSSAPNLEYIDLEGCNSLLSISQSISYLDKLVFLNLKGCSSLESIPSLVDSESLEVLNLSGCSKLENFPEISSNVKELYMGGTMVQEIPSSIKNLIMLEKLDLENSVHLKNLPASISKLKHLETLNLSGCTSLDQFPDLSRKMKCLRFLDLSRTAIKELPSSISNLIVLEELRFVDCRNLVRLPDNTWSLRFKVEFRQIDTEKFSRLWNRLGWLKKVQIS